MDRAMPLLETKIVRRSIGYGRWEDVEVPIEKPVYEDEDGCVISEWEYGDNDPRDPNENWDEEN